MPKAESMNYKFLTSMIERWKAELKALESMKDLIKHCKECNTWFDVRKGNLDKDIYELMALRHEKH